MNGFWVSIFLALVSAAIVSFAAFTNDFAFLTYGASTFILNMLMFKYVFKFW